MALLFGESSDCCTAAPTSQAGWYRGQTRRVGLCPATREVHHYNRERRRHMSSNSPETESVAAAMVLERLRFFGPQKFRQLHRMGVDPLDVIEDPGRLTVGGSRLASFREHLGRVRDGEWQGYLAKAERQLAAAARHSARIVLYADPDYPPALMSSAYPIPILFVRGSGEVLRSLRTVACVGSRQIRKPYEGLHRAFAQAAVDEDFAVVSGFALGADTIGHRAARDEGGATVGVMAGGLDRPFPPENKGLWAELLDYSKAVFVSESPFGTGASAMTLRKRNKLIVALSLGVLVSQSSAKGGAMNAYRFAAEEHKIVATFKADGSEDTTGNTIISLDQRVEPTVFPLDPSATEYRQWLRRLDSWI